MLENVFQHSKRNFVSPSGPNNILLCSINFFNKHQRKAKLFNLNKFLQQKAQIIMKP